MIHLKAIYESEVGPFHAALPFVKSFLSDATAAQTISLFNTKLEAALGVPSTTEWTLTLQHAAVHFATTHANVPLSSITPEFMNVAVHAFVDQMMPHMVTHIVEAETWERRRTQPLHDLVNVPRALPSNLNDTSVETAEYVLGDRNPHMYRIWVSSTTRATPRSAKQHDNSN